MSASSQKSALTFEFTKRKRWADLLITELVDVIIFILNSSGNVLYCGTAVTELLGWKDVDLVDCDLNDFIHSEDQLTFRISFNKAVRTNAELLVYIRLKRKGMPYQTSSESNYVLFEAKGYPHYIEEEPEAPKCFFMMAKPYPSKSTTMLNTFLELKIENERLQERLAEAKKRANMQLPSPPTQSNGMYTASTMPLRISTTSASLSQRLNDPSSPFYSTSGMSSAMYDGTSKNASMNSFDSNLFNSSNFYSVNTEEESEEGSKKKKLKKTHGPEQYVCITCGRTDSPEWRKGPLGPKTLCNACGLRWAKQMRKTDDNAEPGGSGNGD